jgi:hypothetical protein
MRTPNLTDINRKYIPAAKTNVLETLKQHGFVPPSETVEAQEKWFKVRNCAVINEVKQ